MKAGFWKKDWFLGLMVSLVLLFTGGSQLIQGLERAAYDWGVRASSRTASDKVVVIAIDDQSIRNIGRWPWSREVHAKMTDTLAGAKAKVIGNLVFFSEPQIDAGLAYINKLLEIFGKYAPVAAEEPVPAVAPAPVAGATSTAAVPAVAAGAASVAAGTVPVDRPGEPVVPVSEELVLLAKMLR